MVEDSPVFGIGPEQGEPLLSLLQRSRRPRLADRAPPQQRRADRGRGGALRGRRVPRAHGRLLRPRGASAPAGAATPDRAALLAGAWLAGTAIFVAGLFEYNFGDTEVEMATLLVLAVPFSRRDRPARRLECPSMFPQPRPRPAPPRPYTVSELLAEVGQALRTSWRDISVVGEIGRCDAARRARLLHAEGQDGCLNAIIFASDLRRVPFRVEGGARGRRPRARSTSARRRASSRSRPPRSSRSARGALQLAFEQLKAKLAAEGLFDAAQEAPLPFLPRRIARRDVAHGRGDPRHPARARRAGFDGLAVTIYPVRVQGEGAAAEIVEGHPRSQPPRRLRRR